MTHFDVKTEEPQNTRSLKARTVSSLFWKLLERGGNSLIQLVVQVVMARLLTPEEFGLLAIMLVFTNVGNMIVQSGLNTALVQSSNADLDDFSTVFWVCLAVSFTLYVAVFAAAPSIAAFYGSERIVWPLRILALLFLVNALNSIQVAFVQRSLRFKKLFYATLSSVVLSGVFGVALALAGAQLWALVAQQLSCQILSCAILAFQIDWRPQLVFKLDRAKKLFSFGWKLLASGLLNSMYSSLADLIVGKQFSAIQLGFVSQGKKYPHALGTMLDGAIQPVMLSAVSRVQDDSAYVKRLVRRALKTSTYLIMPCMTLFALEAEPIVRLLLGEQWLPCVFFLQVYCFTNALLPIHSTNLQALNAMGRSDLFLKLELIKKAYGIAFLLFTAFIMKDVYLMVGSYLITGVVSTFVNAHPNKKVIGYSYLEQVRDIAPGIFLTAVSAVAAWPVCLLGLPDIATILLQAAIMATAYLGLSKLFRIEVLKYLVNTAREMMKRRTTQ